MRWQELKAPDRGIQLHVRRVVDPPGPPVLLLHGLGVGASIWQVFARRLTPKLAAIAPDLRGHGLSDAPPSGYQPADYASDMIELLDGLGLKQVPVVGHSLGALVGLALARFWPTRVSWLVLLDPPVDPDRANPDVPNVYRLRHAPPGELEAYLLRQNPGGGQLLATSLAGLFRQASDAAFEALLQPGSSDDAWDWAAEIDQPCLLVQADPRRGGVLGDAAAQRFAERLPDGRRVKIEGATHSLHASHPAEVAAAILGFYTAVSSSPSASA
jgi:pimeloyl-ACP methyl ester carboxylesterase